MKAGFFAMRHLTVAKCRNGSLESIVGPATHVGCPSNIDRDSVLPGGR